MCIEMLNINGIKVPHKIIHITGDGSCLFRAISFVLYDSEVMSREVREKIVNNVVRKWNYFCVMSHDDYGNNYENSTDYATNMSKPYSYGGLCELASAAQIFPVAFEVYRDGQLYGKFGKDENPVRRLRFSALQDLSNGHFDAYEPY